MLSPNIIIPFDDDHANIPTGFTRETTLDGRFPKGWGSEAVNITGGAATHTHVSPSHTHNVNSHTHASGATDTHNPPPDGAGSGGTARTAHYHNVASSTTSGSASGGFTTGSSSNLPPYYDVIFIKASGYAAIPVNGMMLSQETTHASLSAHAASAGKYLRGADTGQDAGTTGGAYTNTHTISHGHTGSHSHTGTTTNPQSGGLVGNGSGATSAGSDHTHPTTFNSRSDTLSSTPSPSSITNVLAADSSNIEPVYTTLNAYVNDGANSLMVTPGDIAMWLGDEADVPIGWVVCDGNNDTPDMQDQFLKIPSTPAAPSTGGSNTHSHASTSHSHSVTNASHTHSLTATATADQVVTDVGGAGYRSQPAHGHGGTSQTGTVSYASATCTYNSSDNQPPYRTVIYIMCQFVVGGAALFAML